MGMVKAVVSLVVAALDVRLYVLTIYQQILTTTDTAP